MTVKPKSGNSQCLYGAVPAAGQCVFPIKILLISFSLLWICGILCPVIGAENQNDEYDIYSDKLKRSELSILAFKKGKQFYEDGSYDLARSQMQLALQLDKEHLEARYYLGLVESRCGEHKLALEHFKFVYKKKPHFKKLSLEMASSHVELGNCTESRI